MDSLNSSNLGELLFNMFVGATGGDFLLLAIAFIAILGMAFVYTKSKASTSIIVTVGFAFMFSFFVPELIFIWWLSIIASVFILINALKKWITGAN
jgi:hypothetical protein